MIARNIPKVVQAMPQRIVITCSTADYGSTVSLAGCLPLAAYSGTSIGGDIIDRLDPELSGRRWLAVTPSAWMYTTLGTTEANQYSSLAVRIQHGDSSAGGDMVDYVPIGGALGDGSTAALTRNWGTTALTTGATTGFLTTGNLRVQTPPGIYNLQAAKRFLRTMVTIVKNPPTTASTTGWEQAHLNAALVFLAADELPDRGNTTGAFTTSTST